MTMTIVSSKVDEIVKICSRELKLTMAAIVSLLTLSLIYAILHITVLRYANDFIKRMHYVVITIRFIK